MPRYVNEPFNTLPNGLTLVQINPERAVDLNKESQFCGWLFWHHPDGQWVTERKLSTREIEDAYDQSSDMRVLDAASDGHVVLRSKSGVRFA
jgi:hypothetical protein